jgi:predicted GNAT family acetyltransferase
LREGEGVGDACLREGEGVGDACLRERERERERVSASVVREKGEKRGVAASMVFARGRGVSASVREMERGVGECCSREGERCSRECLRRLFTS